MNLQTIQNQIVDRYFGESFTKHLSLVEAIIGHSDFNNLGEIIAGTSSESIDAIFRACTAKDNLSSKYVDKECKNTFMKLKSISIDTDFV